VIDGGSSDGTLNLIKSYGNKITKVLSERDYGIYDAMNKGCNLANGDWIVFMNAGDTFYSNTALLQLSDFLANDADLVYGGHEVRHDSFSRIKHPDDLKKIWKGTIFNHQASIVRSCLMKNKKFDTMYKYSADYEFIRYLLLNEKKLVNSGVIISSFSASGISDSQRPAVLMEFAAISRLYKDNKIVRLYYLVAVSVSLMVGKIKSFLPCGILESIKKIKYSVKRS